jgi:HAD superfamily hydrolase (TIGR01509 family)
MEEAKGPRAAWPDIDAVVFDLDGVLVDSESWWGQARAAVARAHGSEWTAADESSVKGANTAEWTAAMRERLGLPIPAEAVAGEVVEIMVRRYDSEGAARIEPGLAAVERLRASVPLAVASSAHPAVIRAALRSVGLERAFRAVVSSDEVGVGKPAPDVYLEAARRLEVPPEACLVIEDSPNGVEAARSAGMRVIWVGDEAVQAGSGAPGANGGTIRLASLDDLDESMVPGALDDRGRAGGWDG